MAGPQMPDVMEVEGEKARGSKSKRSNLTECKTCGMTGHARRLSKLCLKSSNKTSPHFVQPGVVLKRKEKELFEKGTLVTGFFGLCKMNNHTKYEIQKLTEIVQRKQPREFLMIAVQMLVGKKRNRTLESSRIPK